MDVIIYLKNCSYISMTVCNKCIETAAAIIFVFYVYTTTN
jgi:hypothetical protein